MTPLEIFMLPGSAVLDLLFGWTIHLYVLNFETIIAGIVSWLIWAGILRAAWAITLKLFGFGRPGRY